MGTYYSPVKGWRPKSDKDAVVVYIDKSGKTTGKVSGGNISVPAGIKVGSTVKVDGQYESAGTYIAEQIKKAPTQPGLPSGEKIIYNKEGQPTGVESQKYQQSLSLAEYNKRISQQQAQQMQEKIIYSKAGQPVSVESAYFRQTLGIKEYENEVKRIQEVAPKQKYYAPITGKTFETKQQLGKLPVDIYSTTPLKVYTEPKTGQPIYDIQEYARAKKIPIDTERKMTPQEFVESLKDVPTYDVKNLPLKYTVNPRLESGMVFPITAEDISTVAMGGYGFARGGALVGSQLLLSKPITAGTQKAIDVALPPMDSGFSLFGAPRQIARGGLFLASTPLTGVSFAKELGTSAITKPIETGKEFGEFAMKRPYELGTIIKGGDIAIKGQALFLKKPTLKEPSLQFEKSVQPLSRQRATLILKETGGDYIFGRTKAGDVISIGGKIEKGQTPLKAVLAELKQETGLAKRDITGLKYKGKVVTPEETFFTYYAEVPKTKKLKPSSDIKEIVRISEKQISKYSGQTPRYPAYIPLKGKGFLRAYEPALVKFAETGEKPKLLKLDTEIGEYILGTQSRYDVSAKEQLKYLKEESLLLASGTPNPAKLSMIGLRKEFPVLAGKSERGAVPGLYVQPPVSPKIPMEVIKLEGYTGKGKSVRDIEPLPFDVPKTQIGYVGLSYTGILDVLPSDLGLKIGRRKPTIFVAKESPRSIAPTPKTLKGIESEFIYEPGTYIETIGRAKRFSIGGKKVFVQQIRKVKDIGKAKEVDKLLEELEKGSKLEKIKTSEQLKRITGIEYLEGRYRYIPKEKLLSLTRALPKSKSIKSSVERKLDLFFTEPKIKEKIIKESYPKKVYEPSSYVSDIKKEIRTKVEPYKKIEPYKDFGYGYTRTDIRKIPYISTPKKPKIPKYFPKEKTRKRIKSEETYSVFIRRKGKYQLIATDLIKGRAKELLSSRLLREIARTGKVVKTGRRKDVFDSEIDFMPSEKIFRTYKVRKGKRIPLADTFIQRKSANLQNKQEQLQLADARRLKKLVGY